MAHTKSNSITTPNFSRKVSDIKRNVLERIKACKVLYRTNIEDYLTGMVTYGSNSAELEPNSLTHELAIKIMEDWYRYPSDISKWAYLNDDVVGEHMEKAYRDNKDLLEGDRYIYGEHLRLACRAHIESELLKVHSFIKAYLILSYLDTEGYHVVKALQYVVMASINEDIKTIQDLKNLCDKTMRDPKLAEEDEEDV